MKNNDFYIELIANLNTFGHNCNTKLVYPQELLNISPLNLSNLTLMDQLIMRTLNANGAMSMSNIARMLNIKLPLLSRIAERLVKKECIERFQKQGDRRTYYICLTDKGREMTIKHIDNYKNYVIERLKTNLDRQELIRLKDSLGILEGALQKYLLSQRS